MDQEQIRQEAAKVGMAVGDANAIIAAYGPQIFQAILSLIQGGFSLNWVMQTLENFGPIILDILALFKKDPAASVALAKFQQMHGQIMTGASPLTPATQTAAFDFLKGPLAKVILSKARDFLPFLGLNDAQSKIAEGLLDLILGNN